MNARENKPERKTQMSQNTAETELTEVLRVRREKLAALIQSGNNPYTITKFQQTHHAAEIKESFAEGAEMNVSVAGRLMSKRVMGKASFAHVQDGSGIAGLSG